MPQGMFSGGTENVFRWISVIGVFAAVLAAVLLIRFLWFGAAFRVSTRGRLNLFLGLLVLPAIVLVLGNSVGYHDANANSCFQCHVMDPWVNDLQNPKSQTLASKHWRNRWVNSEPCYTCHAGYGVAGTVANKLSGVTHVWRTYVTSPPDPIRFAGTYPWETCLHCHAPTPKFQLNAAHTLNPELWEKIRTAQLPCLECHEPPHPRSEPFAGRYRPDHCLACHAQHDKFLRAPPHTQSPELWSAIRAGTVACTECHLKPHGDPPVAGGSGTYPEPMCLRCHRESTKFQKSPSHQDDMVKELIFSGQLPCSQCHDIEGHKRMTR